MDPIEQENALLEQELANIKASLNASPQDSYSAKQFLFDVPIGITRGVAGTADIVSYPFVKGLQYAGAPVETFGTTKLLNALLETDKGLPGRGVAETFGVKPQTEVQKIVEFATPTVGGKTTGLKDVGAGLAAYLGSTVGEAATGSPYGALTGALAAPLTLSGAKAAIKAAGPSTEEAGKSLLRSVMGLRKSDYTKVSKNQIIETVPGNYESQVKGAADRLIESKKLGNVKDPNVAYSNLQDAKEEAESAIQSKLKQVDETRSTGIIPRLDKTLEWINTKAPADKVGLYKAKVNEFLQGLKEQGQGSLVYLNQQKKAIGENWKSSPETDPTFWRKFYSDVKTTIEKNAPEVKGLNKQKQDLLIVEPVIERTKRAAEQGFLPQDVKRALLYTTGGAGLPGAMYVAGPVLGTALAGGLALAGTKTGREALGKGMIGAGKYAQSMKQSLPDIAAQAGARGGLAVTESPVDTSVALPANDIDIENALLEEELRQLRASFSK
jgi:hypothetical protein